MSLAERAQRVADWAWLSERRARLKGYTHHGRIYGMPAWVCQHEQRDDLVYAVPKAAILIPIALAADAACNAILDAFPFPDGRYQMPIHIGEPIPAAEEKAP